VRKQEQKSTKNWLVGKGSKKKGRKKEYVEAGHGGACLSSHHLGGEGKEWQEDCKFKTSLSYLVRPCLKKTRKVSLCFFFFERDLVLGDYGIMKSW
jgi:hypothetical protein